MQENNSGNKLAPLATFLAAMLPAVAVLEEYVPRMPPILALGYFYLSGLLCYFVARASTYVQPQPVIGERTEPSAAENTARHLILLGLFVGGFFGASKLIYGLCFGQWKSPLNLGLDKDIFYYVLMLLLWLVAWGLARRWGFSKLELNLSWNWKPVDVIGLAGLGAVTWTALMIYMHFEKQIHKPMHVFGVQQGSVAPWIYIGLGLAFAVANAFSEELWFRSLFLGALRGIMGMWPAIILQGAVFGLIHWFGTPAGTIGVLMAGAWGILLGWWTYNRRCLWQALLVHVLADFAIWYTTN